MIAGDTFFMKKVVIRTNMTNEVTDWAVLVLAEAEEDDLPYVPTIATLQDLPMMTGKWKAEVRAIHAPMAKFIANESLTIEVENESFNRISKYDFLGEAKNETLPRVFKEGAGDPTSGREHPDGYFLLVAGSLSKGSCGAPYFNHDGQVVAMHVASMDDSVTIRDVLARIMKKRKEAEGGKRKEIGDVDSGKKKKKITNTKDEAKIEDTPLTSHLHREEWDSTTDGFHDVKVGLVLCKEPTVAAALKSLVPVTGSK